MAGKGKVQDKGGYRMLAVADIIPTADNPRRIHDPKKEEELAESVRRDGVLQPVLVRPHPKKKGKWDMRVGSRRFAAAKVLGMKRIPAIVRQLTDEQAVRITVVENLQREDLSPFECAEAIQTLMDRGWGIEDVAEQIGKSPSWVARRHGLTKLSERWRKQATDAKSAVSEWPATHLEAIARMTPEIQEALYSDLHYYNGFQLPTRAVLEQSVNVYIRDLRKAPWRRDDAELMTEAGPCAECLKRSSCQPHLFEDLHGPMAKKDRCLDAGCWGQKAAAYVVRRAGQLMDEHGEKLLLVLEHRSDQCLVEGKGVSQYDVERCKKSEKGAQPCFVVNGPEAGKFFWGALHTYAAKPKGRKVGPTPLAERRDQLRRRRVAWMIKEVLLPAIKDKGLPATQELLAFAAVFGTAHRNDSPGNYMQRAPGKWVTRNPWKLFEAWSVEPDTAPAELWKSLKAVLRHRLHYNGLANVPEKEAEEFAALLYCPWADLEAAAAAALPDPKGWAKLNEDGRPKAAPPRNQVLLADQGKAKGKASKPKPERGICRECGCTETTPCMTADGPCAWTDKSQTLCTACEAKKGD